MLSSRHPSFLTRILLPSLVATSVAVGGAYALHAPEASAEVQLPDYTQEHTSVDAVDTGFEAVPEPDIVDRPITYDEERARLTSAYLAHRSGIEPSGDVWTDATIVPRVIVVHHTAGPTAESAFNTFEPVADRRPGLKDYQKLNVSTQFVVERDGTIYRLFDETLAGRHTIGLNHLSIGIENVGGIEGYELTDAQVEANIELISYLKAKYPTITHAIGHHEYRSFEDHPYFAERDPNYRTVKIDPGEEFMAKVRDGIDSLAIAGPPGEGELAQVR